ncbi:MAG: HIT domain-containing protein, partial [Deltaproteobacteria bacterium]|nr:HIT domain-containing protein [Deltaproteobacteria bacterium]
MEKDCLFCKIVNGDIPTEFLHKDANTVVFRDINPQAPVHLLIVPTKHIRSVNDLTDADKPILSEMMMVAKE